MQKKIIASLFVSTALLMTACSDSKTTTETKTAPAAATKAATPAASAEFDYKLTPKKINDNVWCFFGALDKPTKENAGNMANNCYVKTGDAFVVFDTGPSYVFAKQAYAAMSKEVGPLPVKVVVNSHDHDDHWLGNDFYKQKFGTELIGPSIINKNYKAGDQTRMFKTLPENAIKGTNIIQVDKTVQQPYAFEVNGIKFEVIPVGVKAHTPEDYFLFMPDTKVLFAGDLVMNGRITSGRHGSVIGQIMALDMIDAKGWDTLIPGHGFITDKTSTDEARMYFTLTRDRIMEAIENDVDATEINEKVTLPEFKDKKMYDILNSNNVSYAFDEIDML
jgi:glyoxylase-like metal-dependent hydrolase (beta-lactamase superfamily II)